LSVAITASEKPAYSEREAEVLRLFPPATAAYIMGCSLAMVSIKRQRLGIAPKLKQRKPK